METLQEQDKVISIPRIGDKAPEFKAVTTQGDINFPSDYNAAASDLVVGSGSGDAGMTIVGSTVSNGSIAFADGGTGASTVAGAQANLQVDPAGTAVALAIALG